MIPSRSIAQARVLAGIAHGRRAFVGPYQAGLSLTNRCNLRCIHCYFYSPLIPAPNYCDVRLARRTGGEPPRAEELQTRRHLEMEPSRARALVDELLGIGTWRFLFTGNGEVMLHPEALECMARVKRAGRECLLNTNGTLLEAQTIERMVALGVDELRVTTMAGTAQLYGRTHPGCPPGTFAKLRDALGALAERKAAARSRRPVVKVVCVVCRQNAEGLIDLARFAGEVGADAVILLPVDDVGDPALAELVPTPAQAALVREQLGEVARLLAERGLRHNVERFRMVFNARLDTSALYRAVPCYMGWTAAYVHADGSVYPCCRCYEPLGGVREASLESIWKGPAYRAFRRTAGRINKTGQAPAACACDSCCHSGANLRVYRLIHPLAGRRLARKAPVGQNGAD